MVQIHNKLHMSLGACPPIQGIHIRIFPAKLYQIIDPGGVEDYGDYLEEGVGVDVQEDA